MSGDLSHWTIDWRPWALELHNRNPHWSHETMEDLNKYLTEKEIAYLDELPKGEDAPDEAELEAERPVSGLWRHS